MRRDDTVAAPQLTDYATLLNAWRNEYLGEIDDFYKFITTPSAAREEFLGRYAHNVRFMGSIVIVSISSVSNG